MNQTNVTGLVQCRSDLDPARCNRCARFARRTVLTLCPDSKSVSAWFDGCYVEASMARFTFGPTLTRSCSGTLPVQWTGFEPALSVLLASLRTVPVGVHDDRFSYGKTIRSGASQTIHGHIECVRTLSVSECKSCVEQALEKLDRSCVRGYTVVGNNCIATFEALGFMTLSVLDSDRHRGNWKGNKGRRVVVLCWGVVAACVGGFVWTVWLVQRSIVNGAKVAALTTTSTQDRDKYVIDPL